MKRLRCLVFDRWHAGRSGGAEAGFSLLEVLVSLAIVSLLIVAMPSTLQLGRRVMQTSERLESQGTDAVVTSFLQATISRALALRIQNSDGSSNVAFTGSANSLTMVASSLDGPTGIGLFQFELTVTPDDKSLLLWRWSPYRPVATSNLGTNIVRPERVLMRSVATFGLRYFGQQLPTDALSWSDDWKSPTNLPVLVELRLASRIGAPMVFVPILIPILSGSVPRQD